MTVAFQAFLASADTPYNMNKCIIYPHRSVQANVHMCALFSTFRYSNSVFWLWAICLRICRSVFFFVSCVVCSHLH